MVVAFIGVSDARRNALIAANLPVPNPIQIQGMIDTGAGAMCVDPAVLSQLGLTPTGSTLVNTPTTGTQPAQANTYDISLRIPSAASQPALVHHTLPVIESSLLVAQGFHALIGISVLRGCLLTVDGQNGLFSLAY